MERDDLIINDSYSVDAKHDDAHGAEIRKKIVKVTVLLSVITTFEVAMGIMIKQSSAYWQMVKWVFIILTLLKAAYIVLVFMHLGDEKKSLKYIILIPYAIFIVYLIGIAIVESNYLNNIWETLNP
jgi:cytochrome c oxidase subunit IV